MLRKRVLILLGGCFLMASAAWADDVGYVDCSGHSDDTQIFGKARKGPDVVGALPCGEHFTILIYGFIFTRIQTRDGKVGFVFSNLISVDHSGAAVLRPTSERVPVPRSSAPQTTAVAAQPAPATPAPPQPAAAPPMPAQVTPAASAAAPVVASNVPLTTASVVQTNPVPPTPLEPVAAAAQLVPAAAQPTPAPVAPAAPASVAPAPAAEPTSHVAETVAPASQPSPAAASRPESVAVVEPAAPALRDASLRTSWERPIPGARRRTSAVELFGGYAFARLAGGGPGSNLNGAMGSFGWNVKPWLQIVADSSYSVVTVSGTKNVLYGNHFGPRYFHRGRNRWSATPFVEALVGGTRSDSTISGASGYTTSATSLSMKVGGGLDIHPSRRFEIRLFDVDYYRTSFGTNLHQNNYWASAGIVLRLFGGGAE